MPPGSVGAVAMVAKPVTRQPSREQLSDSTMQWYSEALNNCKLIFSLSKELKTFKKKTNKKTQGENKELAVAGRMEK